MKTFKNIAMIAIAATSMMTACVTTSYASNADPISAPSIVSEVMRRPRVMQFYHANSNHQTRRFEYTLDAQGRVTNRIMYGWNQQDNAWVPMCQYHVDFGTQSHELTFSTWDEQSHSFSGHVTTMHYKASDYPEVIALPEEAF